MIFSALILAGIAARTSPVSGATAAPVYAHHAVSTADAATQALFDRGLTLFYAYNGSQGVHVFQQIESRYPKLAMAYWGEALSYGRDINTPLTETNFNAAHAAIEKAASVESESANPSERAYIEAMRLRYAGSWSDRDRDEIRYEAAMAKAVAAYPQDDDLVALYAEALLEKATPEHLWREHSSLPQNDDTTAIVRALDNIIARNPAHIMANHLLIHVFEPSTDRTRAVLAARRLDAMTFAPEDEHLAHMPAHTHIDVGDYADAVATSKHALALFDTYLATPNIDPTHAAYRFHDTMVGFGAAMMLGNYAQAGWFASRLDKGTKGKYSAFAALRFGRPADVPDTQPKDGADPVHLVRAYEKLSQGDAAAAKAELGNALDTEGPLQYLYYALRGAAAAMQNDLGTADRCFKKARALETDRYGGENLPMVPTDEIIGTTAYRAGNYAGAQAAFQDALKLYPNDARALFGLSESLKKLGKVQQAQSVAHDFASVWRGSDTAPLMGAF